MAERSVVETDVTVTSSDKAVSYTHLAKIAEQQARLQDLEKQKTELENTDFVAVARSYQCIFS